VSAIEGVLTHPHVLEVVFEMVCYKETVCYLLRGVPL